MKKAKLVLVLIAIAISSITFARGGGGGGHSSSHSCSHSSESHESVSEHSTESRTFSTEHPYEHVSRISENEIHTMNTTRSIIFYYLLMNHTTNQYDTIKANSKEELNDKVQKITDDGNESQSPGNESGVILWILGCLGLVIIVILIAYRKQIWEL